MGIKDGTILTEKDKGQHGTLSDDIGGEIYNFKNSVLAKVLVGEKVKFELVAVKTGGNIAILKPSH